MRNEIFSSKGVLIYAFDTDTKTVFENGATRPMTATEAAQADDLNLQEVSVKNEQAITQALREGMGTIRGTLGKRDDVWATTKTIRAMQQLDNASFPSGTAPFFKLLARSIAEIASVQLKVMRAQLKDFSGTN